MGVEIGLGVETVWSLIDVWLKAQSGIRVAAQAETRV